MSPILATASAGMSAAIQRIDASAGRVADTAITGDLSGLSTDLVQMAVATYVFKASMKMVETEKSLIGSLLHAIA